jgi:hypothetical protein
LGTIAVESINRDDEIISIFLLHEYFAERVQCLGLLVSIPKIPGASLMYEFLNTYASKNSVEKKSKEKNS